MLLTEAEKQDFKTAASEFGMPVSEIFRRGGITFVRKIRAQRKNPDARRINGSPLPKIS